MGVEKKKNRKEKRQRRGRKEKDGIGDSSPFLLTASKETLPFFSISTSLISSSFPQMPRYRKAVKSKERGNSSQAGKNNFQLSQPISLLYRLCDLRKGNHRFPELTNCSNLTRTQISQTHTSQLWHDRN